MLDFSRVQKLQWVYGANIPLPDKAAIEAERHAILYAAIDRLPSAQRAVVLLHLEGRSHAEIAKLRKVAIITSKVLLVRAKKSLADDESVACIGATQ